MKTRSMNVRKVTILDRDDRRKREEGNFCFDLFAFDQGDLCQ